MEDEVLFKITIDGVERGVKSLSDVVKASKDLREERKELNLTTKEGQARLGEINRQLDVNTAKIKESSSAIEKQRMNIGNYTGALDKLVPGLGSTIAGFQGMTKSALAFLATPIGVVVGALGLALGALMAYFKGSEEGQNKFNKIMQVGGVIMEKITDLIELVGEKIFGVLGKAFTFIGVVVDHAARSIGINTEAVKNFFDVVDERADQFASAEKLRNEQERELTVLRAKTASEVAELIIKSQEAEGQAKLDAFNQAIELQKTLLSKERDFVQTKLTLANLAVEDDPTIENKQKQAEAIANVYNAEASFNEGIKKLNGQRIAMEQELAAALQARLDVQNHLAESNNTLKTQDIEQVEVTGPKVLSLGEKYNKIATKYVASAKDKAAANKIVDDTFSGLIQRLQAVGQALGNAAALFSKDTVAYKAISSARAVIDTWAGVAASLKIGGVLGIAQAFAVGAAGLAAVAKINAVSGFAEGGLTGTRIMAAHGTPISRSNGDNRLATVRTGEVILNQSQQAALGGSRTFASIGVPGFAGGGGFDIASTARRSESAIRDSDLLYSISQIKTYIAIEDYRIADKRYTDVVGNSEA